MRKSLFMLTLLLFSFSNCAQKSQEKIDKKENVLLAKDVIITSSVDIENQKNPEWTAGLKKEILFKKTFDKILKFEVPVYGASPVEFGDVENKTPYPIEKMNEKMNWVDNKQNYCELKELRFYEKWDFNDNFEFTKKALGWCPIRLFDSQGKNAKKLMFYVYPENGIKGSLIASNIIYEFPWNIEYPNINVGFDELGFLSFIINGIKSGKIDTYDPIYLVDKSKRKFTQEELEKYIGGDLNPGLINLYLSSILFEEDWYLDENTLSIQKDVKSIAFVQELYDTKTDSFKKKILFFIFPKKQ
jgi:hypothetical protein